MYAGAGFAIFPCQGKVPCIPSEEGGQGHRDATTDLDTIRAWWERWPDANIGLACDERSGLLAIDVDPRNGGDVELAALIAAHGPFPPTPHQLTGGGGDHYLFKHPGGNLTATLCKGVDVKSRGYIIAAPSQCAGHARPYMWDDAAGLELEPAELSWWVRNLITKPDADYSPGSSPVESCLLARAFKHAEMVKEKLDDHRLAVVCPWRDKHTAKTSTTSTIVFAAAKGSDVGFFHCAHTSEGRHTVADVLDALPADAVEAARVELYGKFQRGDHTEIGRRFLEHLELPTDQIVASEGQIWTYEPVRDGAGGGVFVAMPEHVKSQKIQRYSGARIGYGKRAKQLKIGTGDVAGALKLAADCICDPDFFATAAPGLAFANGFLRLDTMKLEPLTPACRARYAYSFDYVPDAAAPRFEQFMFEIFLDDTDIEEKIAFVQEFAGACLFGIAPRFQTAMVAVGNGSNGKGVLAHVLEKAMPPGTTCAVEPQGFGNEYRAALLAGKRLNVVNEMPERDILDSEPLKAVIAGDPKTARVIYKEPFMFRPTAGHYFAANNLPATVDQSHGFWRRFVVLTFNRRWGNGGPAPDRGLAATLEGELPGVISFFAAGARRLLEVGRYTVVPSSAAALSEWQLRADPIKQWLADRCEVQAPGEPLSKGAMGRDLYVSYSAWCQTNGHKAFSSTKFGARLKGDLGIPAEALRDGTHYALILK